MSVQERIKQRIAQMSSIDNSTPVLLMVSGGSDSVALAYAAAALRDEAVLGPLAMLHVNHHLRADAADSDQEFVEVLSELLDIPLFICSVDIARLVEEEHGNTEAVARRERYQAAHEALESMCMHFEVPVSKGRIFTAHTANDRVENFYMRSIVGTGPGGFRSMKYERDAICHPLLDIGKEELRLFLEQRKNDNLPCVVTPKGQLWCEDETNACTDYFRAYVRSEIVPRAQEKNPQLLETLTRTMNYIADEDDYMQKQAQLVMSRSLRWNCVCEGRNPDYEEGFFLLPSFGTEELVLQRRALHLALMFVLGGEARIESRSVEMLLSAFDENGTPKSGYVTNIQGNLAVSSNKQGVRVEPMEVFRARRKK